MAVGTPLSQRLVLVSDLHMGGGAGAGRWGPGFVDEFDGDEVFPAFLMWLRSEGRRPSRLVLLGDTLDFLRVPVPGALYARNDAEAVGQLERIAAAHPTVFEALGAIVNEGTALDVVVGNHDVELARPAVQRRLRTLLKAPGNTSANQEAVRFHLWGYYVPELLYAEHGNHYHDINSLRRPLVPFQDGRTERPPAARLGSARRRLLGRGQPGAPPLHQIVDDLFSVGRLSGAALKEYRDSMLSEYAAEIGLPVSAVRRLDELGRTSVPATAARIARTRLARGPSFGDAAPEVATSVHRVLAAAGCAVPFCVFGHTHAACHRRLPGGVGQYLNAGTWSTDYRRAVNRRRPVPDPRRRTWVELSGHGSDNPQARLLHWVEGRDPASRVSERAVGRD
jgi:UDP-2,3-diacylglucosamine pyrophosphatase LpxH